MKKGRDRSRPSLRSLDERQGVFFVPDLVVSAFVVSLFVVSADVSVGAGATAGAVSMRAVSAGCSLVLHADSTKTAATRTRRVIGE